MVIVKAIEHTGIDLAGWLAGPVTRRARPPAPAATGPLRGERVAILGEPRDGAVARLVAAAGGRVVAGVGKTTTMLVIAASQPYGRHVAASEPHRRAQDLQQAGSPIEVLTEDVLRMRLEHDAKKWVPVSRNKSCDN
jgi:DNA polymerase-3 subunit epsilon